jgi:hypothetical protein
MTPIPTAVATRLLITVTVALALAAVLRPSEAAAETTFKVDMLSDAIDVSPGDGACATAGGQRPGGRGR